MKIHKGTSRLVIQIGGVVFKFPRIDPYLEKLLCWLKGTVAPMYIPSQDYLMLSGIFANASEALSWFVLGKRGTGELTLARTYFSIGIVNVQQYIDGTTLTEDEILAELRKLPDEALKMVRSLDSHAIFGKHWIRRSSDGVVVLVDYADAFAHNGKSFSAFIAKVGFEAWK
jgi:hypothetical protein